MRAVCHPGRFLEVEGLAEIAELHDETDGHLPLVFVGDRLLDELIAETFGQGRLRITIEPAWTVAVVS